MAPRPSPAEQQQRRNGRKSFREDARQQRNTVRATKKVSRAEERHALAASVQVKLPTRRSQPLTVEASLGPTNSGKTFSALRFLVSEGKGVFAAPLRMLAEESYRKLCDLAGSDRVGLITGEDRINEHAPILACTAEMAPISGHALVLDEVQWAADRDRGYAWTRLLVRGDYRHIRLIGSPDALPLIRSAFPQVEIVNYERLSPLRFIGGVGLREIEPSTVVIAFSRRSVLATRDMLRAIYGHKRVGCLYGAMPLAARREVIGRVLDGDVDILVATDVLGHGVNLPAQTVLFAETEKFDGVEIRDLEPWEAAQIAGRAGRFGFHDEGRVGVLKGLGIRASGSLVERVLTPHVEVADGVMGYRAVRHGRLRAALEDLGPEVGVNTMAMCLGAWERSAREELRGHGWLSVESTEDAQARLREFNGGVMRRHREHITLDQAWRVAQAPMDGEDPAGAQVLRALALDLTQGQGELSRLLVRVDQVRRLPLADAEQAARVAGQMSWIAQSFPELGIDREHCRRLEQLAAERVITCLDEKHSSLSSYASGR